ncbi:uncharacterized protein METZ01_LOCUS306555, partial [marine metagenome]
VFTYQSNLNWIGRKFLIALYLLVSSNLFGLPDWTMQTSNNNADDAYNISASEATQGVGLTGGFRIYGVDVNDNFKVSIAFRESGAFSGGDVWCEIPDLTGQFGCLAVDGDNNVNEIITHTQVAAVCNWPDTDVFTGLIGLCIHPNGTSPSSGNFNDYTTQPFNFDLDPPEITNAIIACEKDAPFNQSYPHYAKIGDFITVAMTADQEVYEVTGNIGAFDVTPTGT